MESKINNLTLEEKVGQLLMFAFHGTEYNESLDVQIKELKTGGVIFFARNITDVMQVKRLNEQIQANAKIPMFIGIDQEGGTVQRIIDGISLFPGAMACSASKMGTRKLCENVAKDLRYLGFNMNFAPVADVNNNKENPVINSRSFSDDKEIVSKYVIDSYQGFQDGQIIPCAKHFPGHGDTKVDSHQSMPKVDKSIKELEDLEFYPFKKAIDSGIDGIMVSHILYPQIDDSLPATLSKKIVTKVLKDQMNFKGLIVTDSLTMGAIWKNYTKEEIVKLAVEAGIDIMIFCGSADLQEQKEITKALISQVKEGKIPMSRIDESVAKILAYKQKYHIDEKVNNCIVNNQELGKEISEKSITLVVGNKINLSNTLVIFPKIKVFSLVDNEKNDIITLGKVFKKYNINNDEIVLDDDNALEIINQANKLFDSYDNIVLATINLNNDSKEVKLWNSLTKENKKKTIVVSMRSPYDIILLNDVSNYICIYEPTLLSFESLVKSIKNQKFSGTLPVKL